MGLVTATRAGAQEPQPPEWLRSLDELMQIEVTSAAKREHKLADTAAAVFVLTRDDIRRSGFRTVPELLRLVPGVQVAQIDGNKWAVSVRGFNSRWANKLLVMINGRSIYSRLFSGVFWDALGVPVSEIERIEVIRGPGGSLWGANAMNGVINIITRTPGKREGAASASLGSFGASSASVQYAAPLGGWLEYHAYFDASHQGALQPGTSRDDWRNLRAGVGGVATVSRRDEVRVETRALDGESWSLMDQALTSLVTPGTTYLPTLINTVAVSAALGWTRTLAGAGALDTTVSVEDVRRDEGPIRDVARVLEVTFQHTAPRRGRHEATWGLVTQRIEDKVTGTETFRLIPDVAKDSVFGAFAQDDVAWLPIG
jgi:iron complex outermembrane receptor protein